MFKALAGDGPPLKKATGPRMAMRVVGIVAAENEFSYGQGATYTLYPGPAFAVATTGTLALTSYYVRLRHGQADFARFEARTSRLEGTGVQDLDRPAATITNSIHPQAVGWLVLAALAGLAAVAVVGSALARQADAESADHPVLAALGVSPRQLATRIMLRTLVVAVVGAVGGIALATLLSPLAPLGEARLAEPAPGLSFDAAVLAPGALVTATDPGGHVHAGRFRVVGLLSLLLGGVVAVCGLAALAHLLVVSVARRRTESGLLMALGMVRRQLAEIVFWQATTVAVVAVAAGIPLGIAAGRAIWRAFAISLGVVPVPVVQAWLIAPLAADALLSANALAAVPAMSAARSRPGQLLRTE